MNYPFKCELRWAADKAGKELYKCSPFTTAEMHCVNALVLNPACYLKGFFPFILWRIASNLGMSSPPVAQWNSATPLAGLFIDPAWKGPNIHYQVHLVKMVIHSLPPECQWGRTALVQQPQQWSFPPRWPRLRTHSPAWTAVLLFNFKQNTREKLLAYFWI